MDWSTHILKFTTKRGTVRNRYTPDFKLFIFPSFLMHLTINIFLDPLDTTRLGVWILDGDPLHRSLLQYALTPKSVTNTVIVQVVDISRPWTIMESLHSWTEVLREQIHSLKLTPKDLNEMEERSKLHLN